MKLYPRIIFGIIVCVSSTLSFAAPQIVKVKGDNRVGILGREENKTVTVRVLSAEGEPVSAVPVKFTLVASRGLSVSRQAASGIIVSPPVVASDADGYASAQVHLGHVAPAEITVIASTQETIDNPAVFTVSVKTKKWIWSLLAGALGGLGIFLFGIQYLNAVLRKVAGKKLREVLITLTRSPFRGLSTGFFVTMLNQASSATTVLEVTLVNAGLLTFYQTLAVTMGAEIGSTVTAQLVAFRITDYAVLIAGFGFYLSFLSQSKRLKNIGEIIIGIGLLFLGIKIMSEIFSPIQYYEPFVRVMEHMENPVAGIFAGFVVTTIVRSSGITAGVIIALALAHAVTLVQAVPILLGSQVGTCSTAIIASWGRKREAKRVAWWHTIHQIAGVILIYPFLTFITYHGEPAWIYCVKWVTIALLKTQDLARQIAVSHTLAALINTVVFFPFLPLINKALCALLPSKEEEKPFGPLYLDESFLGTPSLALEQARKEIVRAAEIVLGMLKESLAVFNSQDLTMCESIVLKEMQVDVLRNAIMPYLTNIGQQDLTEDQMLHETKYLLITDDLEAIGDIIDKNIVPLITKKLVNKLWFSDAGWQDIVQLHSIVTDKFEKAVQALKNDDGDMARLIISKKAEVNAYYSDLRKKHIARLHSGIRESIETSGVHLDLIDQFKNINSRITTLCFAIIGNI